MRKYTIPRIAYVLLALIISCLSIGYTYAYFSARHEASSEITLGKTSVLWKDFDEDAYMSSLFGDSISAISVATDTELSRGEYTTIKAVLPGQDNAFLNLSLAISNDFNATVGAYCRIKIIAKYTPEGSSTEYDCPDGWVQLGLNSKLITANGWFESDGYYYYGKVNSVDNEGEISKATLTELTAGGVELIANQLYLSSDASAEVLDSMMSVVLVLDGVQITNNAYQQVWGVSW